MYIQLPVLLNEILLKLVVGVAVLNLPVGLKECLNAIWVSNWLHTATDIVVVELQYVQVPLIPNDHVVKNTQHYFIMLRVFLSQKRAGPRTMTNLVCKTPKALSVSFWHASYALEN